MNLMSKVERKGVRKTARELDLSSEKIQQELEELGFTNLEDFSEKQKSEMTKIDYNLSDMEKRKIQGLFGEKITVFIEGKIKEFIKKQFNNSWVIKSNLDLRTLENSKHLHFGNRRNFDGNSLSINRGNITHFGLNQKTIKEKVQEKHFSCTEYLFEKFQEYQIPSIDHILYAVKKTGETENFGYRCVNKSKNQSLYDSEKISINLDKIEDFKIIGLEVKTSADSEPEELFSRLQRSVRDTARESAFLDLYSVHVRWDVSENSIPEKVPVKLEKL